jgi:hypothetical protein
MARRDVAFRSTTAPFFPGYTAARRDRPTLLKQQNFKVISGLMDSHRPDPSLVDVQIADTQRRLEAVQSVSRDTGEDANGAYFPDYTEAKVPETVVLRFFAFFKQSLTEGGEETYRVRFVRIYYYTEDDTVMVEETRQRNSGMPQGVLLRRMRLPDRSAQVYGTTYRLPNFNIGVDIDLSGTVYHIYDCDDLTRKFMGCRGIEVPPGEDPPDDLYSVKRRITERPIRVTSMDTDKTRLPPFLDYDKVVLRFYAIWDDSPSIFGECRKFILHYFLVDNTIEIRQVLPPNSGRDPVSMFLKRTLLKKPDCAALYTAEHLYIGQTVDVYGRTFFIYAADGFTQQWCDAHFGSRDWTPIQVDDPDVLYDRKRATPPPYNGWGDEADSLGYVYSLHPVPPRKDIAKMKRNQGQVLRFAARFVKPTPQDESRQFVITFDLADDQIAVFERPRRNSGFREGKFFQKAKIRNPATGNYFHASDLRLGEVVTIKGYQFEVLGADEFALGRMEAEADEFPQADLNRIVQNMKSDIPRIERLRKQFEMFDPDGCGFIPENRAMQKLQSAMGLREHEANTIIRRFVGQKGFDYLSFLAVLC